MLKKNILSKKAKIDALKKAANKEQKCIVCGKTLSFLDKPSICNDCRNQMPGMRI